MDNNSNNINYNNNSSNNNSNSLYRSCSVPGTTLSVIYVLLIQTSQQHFQVVPFLTPLTVQEIEAHREVERRGLV